SKRNAGAVMTVNEERANRIERGAVILAKSHNQVEPALSEPDLGLLFADQSDPDRPDDVTRCEPNACRRLTVHRDLELWQPRELFRTQIRNPLHSADECFR